MMRRLLLTAFCASAPARADLDQALGIILQSGPEGAGNAAAAEVWPQIVAAGPAATLPVLKALETANPLAANWLRAAAHALPPAQLDPAALTAFIHEPGHAAAARNVAHQLLAKAAPEQAGALVPGYLLDTSSELRRLAVARLLTAGEAALATPQPEKATGLFREALRGANDEDQVKKLAEHLQKLGTPVNLPRHFGFIMDWKLIGPFDNSGRKGFATSFPPEKTLDFSARYPGKTGEVAWQPFTTRHEYGKVDFNQPLGTLKETTAYAAAEFVSPREQPAEIRLGCKNGWKVWLNGQLLFGRDEYHRGARLDQYRLPCRLLAGPNTILVKCCQNEQTEQWTVEWEFQLRVSDATGAALLATNRP